MEPSLLAVLRTPKLNVEINAQESLEVRPPLQKTLASLQLETTGINFFVSLQDVVQEFF